MAKIQKIKLPAKPTYIPFATGLDFYGVFQALEPQFDNCFILESLGEEGKFSRYSIMGFDPQLIVSSQNLSYIDLRQLMPQKTLSKNYAGGLVGYLSYETVNYFEPTLSLPIHPLFDQFKFGVYTDGLILDKLTGELIYFYFDHDKSQQLRHALKKSPSPGKTHIRFIKDSLTKAQHQSIVATVKQEILAGNTFQCEVGFKSVYAGKGDTLPIYTRLRQINPSPFMYYLKFGSQKIIGASPELLFSLRGKEMTTRPLAGTTTRGQTVEEDQRLARILLNNPKEIAEHSMLVDLHRNDLGRVAQFGTVSIRDLMTIKKYSHVQHISSEITGLIHHQYDAFDGIASNFPMGTVTGTPKIETIKIIAKNEPQPRGPYGGGVGQFGFNGDCTFALALRSLFINNSYAFTQTSSGIVADSDANQEYLEITRKLAAMKTTLESL